MNSVKWISAGFGLTLLILNIYGVSQDLRPKNITIENLRFGAVDQTLSEVQLKEALDRKPDESDQSYANRISVAIADGLAHIHWEQYEPGRFNQRVPAWENYILWSMAWLTDIPEFDRYHFTIANKAIERGIGICGDASMLMSYALSQNGVNNHMLTVPGHVMIEAEIDGRWLLFDPDFGVTLNMSLREAKQDRQKFERAYRQAGRYDLGVVTVSRGLASEDAQTWDGPKHFLTKKYYFERASYIMKWLLPIGLLLFWILSSFGTRRAKQISQESPD